MRRILFSLLVFVLAMGVISAYAGEGCGQKAASTAAGESTAKSKACCAGKHAAAAATMSDEAAGAKAGHVCPDVSERTALMNFHEAMHPMHMAAQASDFDGLREKLPTLVEASKAVGDYKCAGYEKCTDICRTNFDGKKGELLESVNNLKEACKGQDNEKVAEKFNTMHEAYITFANACVDPETEKTEEKKAE